MYDVNLTHDFLELIIRSSLKITGQWTDLKQPNKLKKQVLNKTKAFPNNCKREREKKQYKGFQICFILKRREFDLAEIVCFPDRIEIDAADFSDSLDIPMLSDLADNTTELADKTNNTDDCVV